MEVVISKIQLIAYIGAGVSLVGILTSYVIAVHRGDVPAWLPYISDAGGEPPQSSIFSFSMIVASFCFVLGAYVCYLIIMKRNTTGNPFVKWLNRLIILTGAGASTGMAILAVNPIGHLSKDGSWVQLIFIPHMVGAIVMFASGISLMVILAICTFILDYPNWKTCAFFSRCASASVGTLAGILTIACGPFSDPEVLKPRAGEPRYYPPGAIVSTISEWVIVLTFLAFTLSFTSEFRKFRLRLKLEYVDQETVPVLTNGSPASSQKGHGR